MMKKGDGGGGDGEKGDGRGGEWWVEGERGKKEDNREGTGYQETEESCIKSGRRVRLGGSVSEASAFSSGHDLKVLGLSPKLGSLFSRESVIPFLCPPPTTCTFSLS